LERSTNLNLYLSNTTSLQGVTPFATRVSASALGQTLTVAVPDGFSGQYLSIMRNGSDTAINLHEVTILASSEQGGSQHAMHTHATPCLSTAHAARGICWAVMVNMAFAAQLHIWTYGHHSESFYIVCMIRRAGMRWCGFITLALQPCLPVQLCRAVTPCPPPPPPLPVILSCPVPMIPVGGSMSPGCLGNDCGYWGWAKAVDGVKTGHKSMAHTDIGVNPYLQFDLGSVQSTLDAVVMVVRTDCCLERSTNLNLYLSSTPSIQGVAPFVSAVSASVLGETLTVAVPDGVSGQYLTILRNGSDTFINLHEVTILASSE
jgi:hypothetical protein